MAKHSVFCIETFLMILLVALVAMNSYQIIQNNTLKMLVVGPEPNKPSPSNLISQQPLSPTMGNPLGPPHDSAHGFGSPQHVESYMGPPNGMPMGPPPPMAGPPMGPPNGMPMGPPGPPMGPPMGMPQGMPMMGMPQGMPQGMPHGMHMGPQAVTAREGFNAMF